MPPYIFNKILATSYTCGGGSVVLVVPTDTPLFKEQKILVGDKIKTVGLNKYYFWQEITWTCNCPSGMAPMFL